MSLLTAPNLIRAHSIALFSISYYLLTNPPLITDQNLIFMLGEAMSLPHPPSSLFSTPNSATALIALLLILWALTDLSSFSLLGNDDNDDKAHFYWRSVLPVRLGFFFAVTGGSYLGAEGAGAMLKGAPRMRVEERIGHGGLGGWREGCCNSLVFSWGFLEMVFWFWMFVMLREEGKKIARKMAMDLKGNEDGEERRRRGE